MEIFATLVVIAFVVAVFVWPLTWGRRYFIGRRRRARDVANQVWAGRPNDGLNSFGTDPVKRGPLIPQEPEERRD